MEERILLKAEKVSVKRLIAATLITAVILSALWYLFACYIYYTADGIMVYYGTAPVLEKLEELEYTRSYADVVSKMTFFEYMFSKYNSTDIFAHFIIPFLLVILWKGIRYLQSSKCELAVTNLRVFGKTALGKDYSIPLEQLTDIQYCGRKGMKLICGKHKTVLRGISNRKEVCQCISSALQAMTETQNNIEEQTERL